MKNFSNDVYERIGKHVISKSIFGHVADHHTCQLIFNEVGELVWDKAWISLENPILDKVHIHLRTTRKADM